LLYRLEEEEEDLEALALPLQEGGEAFNVSLRRLEGKRRREKKRTSRLLPSLFRETPDLLVDLEEIASSWMKE
jgi:hypothetical protein